MIPRWILGSLAALCATVLLGGCGFEFSVGGQTVDAEDLESELRAQLAAQAGSPPQSVSCPTGITAESGKEFDCTGVAPNGSEFTIEVTLTNDDGGFDAFVPPGQFDSGGEQGTAQ